MNAFLKAEKIWIDTDIKLNVYADFYDKFNITESRKTELYITADTGYQVFVNGKVIDGFQFADFPNYKVFDKYDITDLVKMGENTLLVIGYSQGESSFTYKLGEAGLLYEVRQGDNVLCYSSESTLCRLNANYKSGEVERLTWQESYSFRYSADGAENEFKNATVKENYKNYYPRAVKQLEVKDRCPVKIQAEGVYFDPEDKNLPSGEHMKQTALITLSERDMGFDMSKRMLPNMSGVTLSADKGNGIFIVVDLLKEQAGYLDFEFELPNDAEIYIGFGEHINSLRVRTSIEGRQFAAVYKAKAGLNKFTHRFKRFAGRYIELHIPAKSIKVNYIGLLPTEYPLCDVGGLNLRDNLHKKIYEVAKHTLQLCMHEHYEDCPWREQALYAMDSRIEMLSTYHAFGEYDFARESLRLFALSQRENGQIELCAPADSPIYIPSFTLCFVIEAAEYMRYSGDTEFLGEIYPVLKKLIDSYSQKMTDNGLIASFTEPEAWNFYEWAPGLDGRVKELWPEGMDFDYVNEAEGKTVSAPLNLYLSLALDAFSKICEKLGKNEEKAAADLLRKGINTALKNTFWNEEKGLFASYLTEGKLLHYCELTQALALCSGVADEIQSEKIRAVLKANNGLIPITLGSSFYKYEALLSDKENIGYVFDDIAEKWGGMLFNGATSFWETFSGDDEFTFGGATSLCHGWASLPIHFYYTYGKDALI